MAIRVRYVHPEDSTALEISIERLADGHFLDFDSRTFKPSGWVALYAPLGLATTGPASGRRAYQLADTPEADFPDGDYAVYVHDSADAQRTICALGLIMTGGHDRTLASLYMGQALVDTKAKTVGGALHGGWILAFGAIIQDVKTRLMKFFGIGGVPEVGQPGGPDPAVTHQLDNVDRPLTRRPLP